VSVLIAGDRMCFVRTPIQFNVLNGFWPLTIVGTHMPLAKGFTQLGAGLAVGLAGLAAGFAVGIVGDAGVRGTAQQPRLFVGMVRDLFLLLYANASDLS